jgi:hypothetical protein
MVESHEVSEKILVTRISALPRRDNGGREKSLISGCFAGRYYYDRKRSNSNGPVTNFTFYDGESKKYAVTESDFKKVTKSPGRPVNSFLYARNFLSGLVQKKEKKSALFISKVISDVSNIWIDA